MTHSLKTKMPKDLTDRITYGAVWLTTAVVAANVAQDADFAFERIAAKALILAPAALWAASLYRKRAFLLSEAGREEACGLAVSGIATLLLTCLLQVAGSGSNTTALFGPVLAYLMYAVWMHEKALGWKDWFGRKAAGPDA